MLLSASSSSSNPLNVLATSGPSSSFKGGDIPLMVDQDWDHRHQRWRCEGVAGCCCGERGTPTTSSSTSFVPMSANG